MFNYNEVVNYFLDFVEKPTFYPAITAFAITFVALYVIKFVLINRLNGFASKTKTDIDDFLVDLINVWNFPSIIAASLLLFIELYGFGDAISLIIDTTLLIFLSLYFIQSIRKTISYALKKGLKRKSANDILIISAANTASTIVLYTVLILVVLQNVGIDITALVTGLGIGGIAIAFALQNILGDIFSAFTIYFDKPFAPGDIVLVNDDIGEVKKIGLRSTRIKTLRGEELVISNQELASARIHNFDNMGSRRIFTTIGVLYETDPKKLKTLPDMLRAIIDPLAGVDFERAHLLGFGAYSINYEIVYNILSKDYNEYMDIQQEINFAIIDLFAKHKIEFAYPTQVQYNK